MKKVIYKLIHFIIVILFIGCGPDKITFNDSDVQVFNKNSIIIKDNIESIKQLKNKNGYPLFENKSQLDSNIGSNSFEFNEIIKKIRLEDDNVTYILNKKDFNSILGLDQSKYNHQIVYTFRDQINGHVDFDTKKTVYLIDNGIVNPKWSDIWGVLEIVYWKKLDENLYYIIFEETLL